MRRDSRSSGRRATPRVAAAFALVALFVTPALASCPVEVDFPFLDFDGNLCHDATDSGDIRPQLESITIYSPGTGNLVCPDAVHIHGRGNLGWNIPGTVVLGCDVSSHSFFKFASASLNFNAGEDFLVGGKIKVSGEVNLDAPAGDISVADRVSIGGVQVSLDAGGNTTLGERVRSKTKTGVELSAGGTLTLGARTNLRASSGSFGGIVLIGHDIVLGERVKLKGSTQFSMLGLMSIVADETAGTVMADGLSAVSHRIEIRGGTIVLTGSTRLKTQGRDTPQSVRLVAGTAIAVDGARIQSAVPFSQRIEFVVTGGTALAVTNAVVRGAQNTVLFQTAPGGTCDVTGTKFVKVTPEFVDCTPVGLGG